jgi:DNA-binding GntR family transcriptional regulator
MSQVERYLRAQNATPMRETEAGAEHRAILRAVRARNAVKARDLIAAHIQTTRRLMFAAISAAAGGRNG